MFFLLLYVFSLFKRIDYPELIIYVEKPGKNVVNRCAQLIVNNSLAVIYVAVFYNEYLLLFTR